MSQPIPAPVARGGRRDVRLDALRGLFLLLMFSSHLGTPLTRLTVEPFGYVSSAEGFVFLAAFLAGIVYRKTYETKGYDAMRDKAWRRAGLIYLCHVGLLMAGFLFAYLVGETGDPVSNIFKGFYDSPLTVMGLATLLLYQPPLFDILPLYVIGLLATPLLLAYARRRGWGPIVGFSILVWLLERWGLKQDVEAWANLYLPVRTGSFDQLSWQLIWVGGLWLGHLTSVWRRNGIAQPFPPLLVLSAIAGAVVLFLLRQHLWGVDWVRAYYHPLLAKWTLAPLRVANLAFLIVLLIRFAPRRLPAWLQNSLGLLGRHSLPVFCFQIPLSLAGIALIYYWELRGLPGTLLTVAGLGMLFLPAMLAERYSGAPLPVVSTVPVVTHSDQQA